ncbi:unnamed protein product [Prunus armeniaca]|uniref:IST1-like protein n=1 Tax=Prunus armeniaca TaxID=36596 RepID=A0A6J5VA42_PRUAR|nr:unnamed protein product [Prunus armeniaca]
MKLLTKLFGSGFNSSECKETVETVVVKARFLQKKKQDEVARMKSDIAGRLRAGEDPIAGPAHVLIKRVIREQNVSVAYEFIEAFCDLVVDRISTIKEVRECPENLKEGISSLVFAAKKCSHEIPELVTLGNIFRKKYGKKFISAATNIRPNCGVDLMMIKKLADTNPQGDEKLKIVQEIADQYSINGWVNIVGNNCNALVKV